MRADASASQPSRRVLVVPKWYPWPDRPVLGLFCREHARALATANDVVVLASDAVRRPPFLAFELTDAVERGLRTLRVRYRRPALRPAAMAFQLAGMLVMLRRLRREGWRPDVVHAHVYSAALPALVLARRSGAPLAVTEHYTGYERGLVRGSDALVAKLAFRRADLLAPVSEDLGRQLGELAPGTPLRVLPNTVDTGVFHPRSGPRAAGPARLLNVAALAGKKGHAVLLEALVRMRHSDATLEVVGEGELRSALERRSQGLGVDGRVRFVGAKPPGEVARLLREADLFVLPSFNENLPVVLIEAMASGVPWVATRVGGVPELLGRGPRVESGQTGDPDDAAGLLVEPGDPDALAEAIDAMLDRGGVDAEALARRTAERFGYAAVASAWDAAYDELSSAGSTSSATRGASASRR